MAKALRETKHLNLTRELREEVRRLGAGEAIATVQELRSRYGVSQATISRAVERLRKEGLVYRPAGRKRLYVSDVAARGLRRVLVVRPTFPSPDFDAVLRELIAAGRALGWVFETYAFQWTSESLDLDRLASDYDGVILACSAGLLSPRFVASLRNPTRPLVLIRDLPLDPEVPGVSLDNVEVGRLATEYLARMGHRDILCLVSEPPSRTIQDRVQGWRQAMAQLGHNYVERLLVDCPIDAGQDSVTLTWEHFRAWMRNPSRPTFSAIFTVDWTGAMAAIRALREDWGLSVPEDVSIMSYGGETVLAPFMQPPLSTVSGNVTHVAEQAIYMLERQCSGKRSAERQVLLKPHVVQRKSIKQIGVSVWPETAGPAEE